MKHRSSVSFSAHDHTELVQELLACAMVCETCANENLHEGDGPSLARCIKLSRDCAEICLHAAALLQRNSELSHSFLIICEKACRVCADECGKHTPDHCKKCEDVCQRCAEACHDHHGVVKLT